MVTLYRLRYYRNSHIKTQFKHKHMEQQNFHNFSARNIQGEEIKMDTYKGKVVLVVNTASKCGLVSQFKGLEQLYRDYKDKGLEIIGFPCNQFANQEPLDDAGIVQHCTLNYDVSFPMFAKVEVNGDNAHPIYQYLKSQKKGIFGKKIEWNFTKFLIDAQGQPVERFSPITAPEKIAPYLDKMLK